MCETSATNNNGVSYHCEGHELVCSATGYDMNYEVRKADAPALRDALNHRPGKTLRKRIESRLRRLEREAISSQKAHGHVWCGVGKKRARV